MEPQEPQHNLSDLIIEALKAKGVNLTRLSDLTDISEHILATLVDEKYGDLPAAPYVHGYLLKIAQALNMDGEQLWSEYLKDRSEIRRPGAGDVLPQNRFRSGKFNKKAIAIAAIVVIVFGYIVLRLPGLFGSPSFDLGSIPATVSTPELTIQGKMNPADQLTLNGQSIYPDQSGAFVQKIVLQPGFNTLTFEIKKLVGQAYTVTRQVFYNAPSSTNAGGAPARSSTSTEMKNTTSTIH